MNDPLRHLPKVSHFSVEVSDINEDGTFKMEQYSGEMGVEGGADQSPALTFENVPEETRSFVIQVYDPDAPTLGGYWHWTLINVPGNVRMLDKDTGNPDQSNLPEGAENRLNDAGFKGYIGAAPPEGETHRYYIVVSALDIDKLAVEEKATPNVINFQMNSHVIGRAVTIVQGSN